MKQITLSKGYTTTVTNQDYKRLSKYKWYALESRYADGTVRNVYAVRSHYREGKREFWYMHRIILGVTDPTVEVDHKNNNGLDNRRGNLRLADRQSNNFNVRRRKDNTTGFRGVSRYKDKFRAEIQHGHLGVFDTLEEAAAVYKVAAAERFGKFVNHS
jgi:hypothetical protein